MATGWSRSTKEKTNFSRLCQLLIDGGKRALKDVFDAIHPPSSLRSVLIRPKEHSTLKGLMARKVLTSQQWERLYPASTPATSASFDITLLFVLLRNICGLTPPATGWDKPPAGSDNSREADLVRIKLCRNELYGHVPEPAISDSDFEKWWNEIETPLLRLGIHKPDIDELKVVSLDPKDEEYFIRAIEESEQLEERIMSKLDDIKRDISMLNSTSTEDNSQAKDYTNKLKSSIKSQTNFLPRMKEDKQIRTDDLFTSIIIQRGQKKIKSCQAKFRKTAEFDEEKIVPSCMDTTLKKSSELFIFPENKRPISRVLNQSNNPKSILVTGQAGIGKSLFCQKLVRDWANDVLFEKEDPKVPNFQFVFLLTFRQLNLLGQKMMDLRELLNRSKLLNEYSIFDDDVLVYILQNPEKLLLIIDGYDEYSFDDEITGDSEVEYPNNPKEKMPVPAMVAKLLKGKILQESVIMMTSRPAEVVNMDNINFDARVEIEGFSSQQIMEFIEKYFKDNESMKKTVLEHFQLHKDLFGFCHVPVICYLMCYCLEWHITHSDTIVNLPITRTDLYYEVSKVFIKKHHVHLKYAERVERQVQEMLKKLAGLAGQLLQEEKYIFDQDDLTNTNFSEEEVANLKASGLLYCFPGTRKSPFADITLEYSFIHSTIQEYLAAYSFVEKREIPESTSHMVLQFISGLLSKKNDEMMMTKITELVKPVGPIESCICDTRLLTGMCLYEYGDMEFAKRVVMKNFDNFFEDGCLTYRVSSDEDSIYISYIFDILNSLNEELTIQNKPLCAQRLHVHIFDMGGSSLTPERVKRICKSLTNEFCTVTTIRLFWCEQMDDDCVEAFDELLAVGKIVELQLTANHITDKGVASISKSLKNKNSKLRSLDLCGNKVTDEGLASICESLTNKNCQLTSLYLSNNEITDQGLTSICESLINKNCQLTDLGLINNEITDDGVSSFFESLINKKSKLTSLDLNWSKFASLDLENNEIPDKAVNSICEFLINENCKLTSLKLIRSNITDKEVIGICESLRNKDCKLMSLDLSGNEITDEGVSSICESLLDKNCKLTSLNLSGNSITDDGANVICKTVIHKDCALNSLDVIGGVKHSYKITDECKRYNSNIVKQYKPGFNLNFSDF